MEVTFFPAVHCPPTHKDKGAEVVTENFGCLMNMVEIAFWKTSSVRQMNFIPEYKSVFSIKVVVGENPNLHWVAQSYLFNKYVV